MAPHVRGRDASGNLGFQSFGRPQGVETDVEQEPDLGGDDVRRRIADIDADHFEVRRIEVGIARVERRVVQRREHRGERPDRVVGDVRIGDMALAAVQRQPPRQRARRPCLIVSPSVFDAGRLADDAMVEVLAPVERPVG